MNITSKEVEMLQEDVHTLASILYDLLTNNPRDLNILDMTSELNYIIDRNKPED
jgi:hypothetical protein